MRIIRICKFQGLKLRLLQKGCGREETELFGLSPEQFRITARNTSANRTASGSSKRYSSG